MTIQARLRDAIEHAEGASRAHVLSVLVEEELRGALHDHNWYVTVGRRIYGRAWLDRRLHDLRVEIAVLARTLRKMRES